MEEFIKEVKIWVDEEYPMPVMFLDIKFGLQLRVGDSIMIFDKEHFEANYPKWLINYDNPLYDTCFELTERVISDDGIIFYAKIS